MKKSEIDINVAIAEDGISATIRTDGHPESALAFTLALDRRMDLDALGETFVQMIESTIIDFVHKMSQAEFPAADVPEPEAGDDHLRN